VQDWAMDLPSPHTVQEEQKGIPWRG